MIKYHSLKYVRMIQIISYVCSNFGVQVAQWLSSRALDLRSLAREFDSHRRQCCVATLSNCSHPCASATKQYNLVLVEGW